MKRSGLIISIFLGLALSCPFLVAEKTLAAPTASPMMAGATSALGPNQHGTSFIWTASADATTGTTSNVYKVAGSCPSSLVTSSFKLLASNVAANGPYTDLAVVANQTNSYVVTNVIGGVETGVSNCVTFTTPNFPPQSLSGTAQ
jgi:hypothetical protein